MAKNATKAKAKPGWEMTILAPAGTEETVPTGKGSSEFHSKGLIAGIFGGEEVPLDAAQTEETTTQWTQTVTGLLATVNQWSSAATAKWKIDEVTVGLTLSAEGKLLFIAKGSAEASIEIKLKYLG
ncbi:CU044_2847 family protein [Kaistia dalseonensis]|uniref:Pepco domain-containing protein n=1 Tax=Kaistia dalseonensis TaxID=410840 RepID=A0ABU0HBV3_9HYPH|nr:CU044_2847 family protein [Kaistia dalseonensis]MCX5497160.1 CU044_2847 family protein [Kaistia dalseonensis]MDQ0439788.1 hypothetical protein [Kaistia dalseonensis]